MIGFPGSWCNTSSSLKSLVNRLNLKGYFKEECTRMQRWCGNSRHKESAIRQDDKRKKCRINITLSVVPGKQQQAQGGSMKVKSALKIFKISFRELRSNVQEKFTEIKWFSILLLSHLASLQTIQAHCCLEIISRQLFWSHRWLFSSRLLKAFHYRIKSTFLYLGGSRKAGKQWDVLLPTFLRCVQLCTRPFAHISYVILTTWWQR